MSSAQAKKELGNSIAVPVVDAIVGNMLEYYEKSIPIDNTLFDYLKEDSNISEKNLLVQTV